MFLLVVAMDVANIGSMLIYCYRDYRAMDVFR